MSHRQCEIRERIIFQAVTSLSFSLAAIHSFVDSSTPSSSTYFFNVTMAKWTFMVFVFLRFKENINRVTNWNQVETEPRERGFIEPGSKNTIWSILYRAGPEKSRWFESFEITGVWAPQIDGPQFILPSNKWSTFEPARRSQILEFTFTYRKWLQTKPLEFF